MDVLMATSFKISSLFSLFLPSNRLSSLELLKTDFHQAFNCCLTLFLRVFIFLSATFIQSLARSSVLTEIRYIKKRKVKPPKRFVVFCYFPQLDFRLILQVMIKNGSLLWP